MARIETEKTIAKWLINNREHIGEESFKRCMFQLVVQGFNGYGLIDRSKTKPKASIINVTNIINPPYLTALEAIHFPSWHDYFENNYKIILSKEIQSFNTLFLIFSYCPDKAEDIAKFAITLMDCGVIRSERDRSISFHAERKAIYEIIKFYRKSVLKQGTIGTKAFYASLHNVIEDDLFPIAQRNSDKNDLMDIINKNHHLIEQSHKEINNMFYDYLKTDLFYKEIQQLL